MTKLLSVLLVESDDTVVKDVTASLRLANIPVMVAQSLSEVGKILGEVRPGMLVIRASIGAEGEISAFVKKFVARKDIEQIPIVLLMKNSERARVEDALKYCRGTVALPVEFPSFTYRVQELFASRTETPVPEIEEVSPVSPPPSVEEASAKSNRKKEASGGGNEVGARATIRGVDNRLVTAYSIQLLVLDALRKNPAFESANADEVPKLIAEITNKICLQYRPT